MNAGGVIRRLDCHRSNLSSMLLSTHPAIEARSRVPEVIAPAPTLKPPPQTMGLEQADVLTSAHDLDCPMPRSGLKQAGRDLQPIAVARHLMVPERPIGSRS